MMKNRKKVALAIVVVLVILIGFGGIQFNAFIKKTDANINSIVIESVDLRKVADGVFEGDYDAGAIYAKVSVQVTSGKIIKIDLLEHRKGKGGPAEVILDQIVNQQSMEVDNISGATGSSRVIKKAVERALIKGVQ